MRNLIKQRLLIGLILIAQLLGVFLVQIIVIRSLGVGSETDIFVAAQAVPLLLTSVVVSSLQSVWMPKFSISTLSKKDWIENQATAQGQSILLTGGLAVFAILSIKYWMPLLFSSFTSAQIEDINYYSFILFFAALINTQIAVLTFALRATNKFVFAEFANLFGVFVLLILTLILVPKYGVVGAVLASLFRSIFVYLVLLSIEGRPKISLIKGAKDIESWGLMRPLLFAACLYKTSPLIDSFWASHGLVGELTLINLALTVMGAFVAVLERVLCTPLVPKISIEVHRKQYANLKKEIDSVVFLVTLITLLIAFALFIAKPLVLTIFMHVFHLENFLAMNLWGLCLILLGYVYCAIIGSFVVSVYYAMLDTTTPVKIGLVGYILSIFIKGISFIYFGIWGLAFAISLYYFFNFITLYLNLGNKIDEKISSAGKA